MSLFKEPIRLHPLRAAFLAAPVLAALAHAAADTIKIEGLEYPGVRVQEIADGQLFYTTLAGVEVRQPLNRIEAMKLDAHPQLERAMTLSGAGQHAAALAQLLAIRPQSQWVRQWIEAQIVQTATAADEPEKAVNAYLSLVQIRGEALFLERPPVAALTKADAPTRQRLADKIKAALAREAEASSIAAQLKKLLATADGDGQPQATAFAATVVLPASLRDGDAVVRLLREGRFEAALAAVDQALAHPAGTDLKLYQCGMAQMLLAQALETQSGSERAIKRYKDAGLSFMRVVIYFPDSPYLGAALMEAGYVHSKIGRPDIAAKLYEEALPLIDEEDAPLVQRLDALRQQLKVPKD